MYVFGIGMPLFCCCFHQFHSCLLFWVFVIAWVFSQLHFWTRTRRTRVYKHVYVCLAKYQNYLDTNTTENRIGSILNCCCWLILSFLLAGQTCLCLSVTQSIRLSPKLVHTSFSFRMPFAFHSVGFVAALLVSAAASFGSLPLLLLA